MASRRKQLRIFRRSLVRHDFDGAESAIRGLLKSAEDVDRQSFRSALATVIALRGLSTAHKLLLGGRAGDSFKALADNLDKLRDEALADEKLPIVETLHRVHRSFAGDPGGDPVRKVFEDHAGTRQIRSWIEEARTLKEGEDFGTAKLPQEDEANTIIAGRRFELSEDTETGTAKIVEEEKPPPLPDRHPRTTDLLHALESSDSGDPETARIARETMATKLVEEIQKTVVLQRRDSKRVKSSNRGQRRRFRRAAVIFIALCGIAGAVGGGYIGSNRKVTYDVTATLVKYDQLRPTRGAMRDVVPDYPRSAVFNIPAGSNFTERVCERMARQGKEMNSRQVRNSVRFSTNPRDLASAAYVIELVVSHEDEETAVQLTEASIKVYQELFYELYAGAPRKLYDYYETEVKARTEEREKLAQVIVSNRDPMLAGDIRVAAQSILSQLAHAQQRRIEIEAALIRAREEVKEWTTSFADAPEYRSEVTADENFGPLATAKVQRIETLEHDIAELEERVQSANLGAEHPDSKRLEKLKTRRDGLMDEISALPPAIVRSTRRVPNPVVKETKVAIGESMAEFKGYEQSLITWRAYEDLKQQQAETFFDMYGDRMLAERRLTQLDEVLKDAEEAKRACKLALETPLTALQLSQPPSEPIEANKLGRDPLAILGLFIGLVLGLGGAGLAARFMFDE